MRRGQDAFTFVELLLVVITIVILSTTVMLAGGEAQSAAKATKIINTLTNLKMFALTWYKDNADKIDTDGNYNGVDLKTYFETPEGQSKIKKFFVNDVKVNYADGGYGILNHKDNDGKVIWCVCHYLEKNSDRGKIKLKLADKAKTSQNVLLQEDNGKWKTYTDGEEIYMQVLALNY